MSNDQQTIDPLFKLRNSPLNGTDAHHSPFYRRLLSAGYKGYIQGSLGGAVLFAGLGALAGVAMMLVAAPILGIAITSAFAAVPIMAGAGLLYGKETFGSIGAMASISAEQAEINEKRRALLDRYFETPSEEEAKEIQAQLNSQGQEKMPKKWFHWKPALIGAVVLGLAAIAGFGFVASGALHGILFGEALKITGTGIAGYALSGIAGALAGSFIGVDRAYIRKWFDTHERVYEDGSIDTHKIEHQQNIERLQQAAKDNGVSRSRIRDDITPASEFATQHNNQPDTVIAASEAEHRGLAARKQNEQALVPL
jgi:hypothetical protein